MANEISIAAAQENQAPVIDLNGEGEGTSSAVTYQENTPDLLLAPDAVVSDPDSADFLGGSLTVAMTEGAETGDRLRVYPGSFYEEEGLLYYQGATIGSVSGGSDGAPLYILFNRDNVFDPDTQQQISRRVDQAIAQELVRSISFYNVSATPSAEPRTVTFTLSDGDGGTSAPASSEVTIQTFDDPAVAEDDLFTVSESRRLRGNLFADNGNGADRDPDGTPIKVTSVNGDATAVGRTIVLESGATLTVNEDGSFVYDPTGAFQLPAASSNAPNSTATDGFSYTVTGGDGADVTITVTGEAAPEETFTGDGSDNVIVGTPFRDIFRLDQENSGEQESGGFDRVFGLDGNDTFYFGRHFNELDYVDGGAGFDVLILQGDYREGVRFGTGRTSNIVAIESISLFSGANASFGDTAGNLYGYNLELLDGNVAAGETLKIVGFNLQSGEDMAVNGAAETNGSFRMFAGFGIDTLIGGAKDDIFVFGHDGRFGSSDSVDGGGGYDVVYLRGDYAIDFTGFSESPEVAALAAAALAVPSNPSALRNIESIGLLSASNTDYAGGGDGEFDYEIVLADAMAADGGRLTVNGSGLGANETMVVDGSDEAGASLRLFGGSGDDTLTGGGGNDLLHGGLGADLLQGNGGADVFRYQSAADSGLEAPDRISFFLSGTDKVDLGRIDTDPDAAGDQAFTFIGEAAFSGRRGELRLTHDAELGQWTAEGDLDGDGRADLRILFIETEVLTGSDFLL